MPRRARVVLPNVPLHVIQRGNNRVVCFHAEEDFAFYLEWLAGAAREHACDIHAYCLMTNHVHLLLTAREEGSVGGMMKALGQRYVQYVNRTCRRSGTLWEGRFRSCLLQEEGYVLACYRYIELNPVRAEMVAHPGEYRWSSYRVNAQNEASPFLSPQAGHLALGRDAAERCVAYRELFRYQLDFGLFDQMRDATNGNYALGSECFLVEVAAALGRRVVPGKPGRPRLTEAGVEDRDC